MRAEQHVSVPRSGQLAVLTVCRARGARLPLLKTPEGTILVSQRSGIRGMSVTQWPTACAVALPGCAVPVRTSE
jgi:hypothetical protein